MNAMYSTLSRLLFCLPPETAHELTLDALGAAERLKLLSLLPRPASQRPVEVMGLTFPNAVGLAAGLDKNGDYIDGLGALGFGFIEIGTVTPRPQPGNPRPRLFRLTSEQAIINRMGFNNLGVDHLVARAFRRRYSGVLGINIGKNADTPVERAVDDYLAGLDKAYSCADYITVNISSPNTAGLRDLQFGENLKSLLTPLKERQKALAEREDRYVPMVVKIAPDMEDDQLRALAELLVALGIDGVIATNTTIARESVAHHALAAEAGGLSGAPLRERSTRVVSVLADTLEGRLPVIGVGGIDSGPAAQEKLAAGAALVQIYTGLIYRGPGLVREAVEACAGLP